MVKLSIFFAALAAAAKLVSAHEAHEFTPIIPADVHQAHARRSLADCAHLLNDPVRLAKREAKRNAMVKRHFESIGKQSTYVPSELVRRAAAHKFTDVQCILAPELTIGPYYVQGELIRSDMSEGQAGIKLLLDMQMVDVNTCKVIPNAYVEFWHCNTAGIYSGVSAQSTLGKTFNRAIQPTDSDGVVQITTTFPGWYQGRATHIHILSHLDGQVLSNNTYTGGKVSHIGQVFFPESILKQFDTAPNYSSNKAARLANSADGIYNQAKSGSTASPESTVELLGSTLAEGVLAYITVGVNAKIDYTSQVKAAAVLSGPAGSAVNSPAASSTSPTVSRSSPAVSRSSSPVASSPASGTCVKQYNQCGGQTYKGATTCCTGTCKYINTYYSQCV